MKTSSRTQNEIRNVSTQEVVKFLLGEITLMQSLKSAFKKLSVLGRWLAKGFECEFFNFTNSLLHFKTGKTSTRYTNQ